MTGGTEGDHVLEDVGVFLGQFVGLDEGTDGGDVVDVWVTTEVALRRRAQHASIAVPVQRPLADRCPTRAIRLVSAALPVRMSLGRIGLREPRATALVTAEDVVVDPARIPSNRGAARVALDRHFPALPLTMGRSCGIGLWSPLLLGDATLTVQPWFVRWIIFEPIATKFTLSFDFLPLIIRIGSP